MNKADNQIISKELLSEVLNDPKELRYENGFILYENEGEPERNWKYESNIHELAHKCKEWAKKQGYSLPSCIDIKESRGYCSVNTNANNFENFEADTEPKAIFAAAQWILEQKAKQ